MIARVAALTLALLVLFGGSARADPIQLLAYERVLTDASAQIDLARAASGTARAQAIARARALLERNREVRVGSATYTAAPHGPVLALLDAGDNESLARASAILAQTFEAVRRSEGLAALDPDRARDALESTLRAPDFQRVQDWRSAVVSWILDLIERLLPGLQAPNITRENIAAVLAPIAAITLIVVAATVLRGARAKLVREALVAADVGPRGPTVADRLREAEEARRAGRLRDALRALFLAALLALERRGALRLDPALTDRELLTRAAHLAARGDLEALVTLYERAWYGLRDPSDADVERASGLARRIAA